MKKIISVLAMALLVIGAAQAQEQIRKMVVQLKNGQVVKYNTENVEDVTFEIIDLYFPDLPDVPDLPNVPTTIEEAKDMLAGYWKWNVPIYDDDIEGCYFIITTDLKVLQCYKFKDSVTEEYYAPYAGLTIAFIRGEVTFPSEEDPTTFYLGEEWYEGTNLQLNSFDFDDGSIGGVYPAVRVEPFGIILIDEDFLFKGKPGLR